MISRAMILAAGIGSRLRPLTDMKPKALLHFQGTPMLGHVIKKIADSGISEIVINLHHHADQIVDYLKENDNFGLEIYYSDERTLLMDTGGAIIKAREFLDRGEPFLIHNIDIFSDLDLEKLYTAHKENAALATLAVKDRETSRKLLIDDKNLLCGWENIHTGESILVRDQPGLKGLAFSGIHILDPAFFNYMNTNEPFSVIHAYLELARSNRIMTYDHSGDRWIDMAHPIHFPELA